jgi:hypothetical protein
MLPSTRKLAEHIAIPVKGDVTSLTTQSIANQSSAHGFQVVNKRAQNSRKRWFTVSEGGHVIKRPAPRSGPGISRCLSVGVGEPQSVEGRPQPHGPALGRDPFQNRKLHVVKPGRKIRSIGTLDCHPDRRVRHDRNECRQKRSGFAEGQHDALLPQQLNARSTLIHGRRPAAHEAVVAGPLAWRNSEDIPTGFSLRAG